MKRTGQGSNRRSPSPVLATAFAIGATLGAAFPAAAAPPPELGLAPTDVRIEQRKDGGYHLYIRAKEGLGSVLLTESTKDPALKADNYAYRAREWNPVNGDEKRMLDGAFIPASSKLYSLIDSTTEADPLFGNAFHVFIPWVVAWGYAWSRSGETFIADGTFINIRAFSKPYADYAGPFADNPYLIRVTQKPAPKPPPPPPPEAPKETPKPPEPDLSSYIPDTVRTFDEVAKAGKGETRYASGPEDIVSELEVILDRAAGKSADIVVCIDTTDSMQDDIDMVRAMVPDMLRKKLAEFSSYRLGLLVYRDYFEEYLYKRFDFTPDFGVFLAELGTVRVAGGRDLPEAVYEALYGALTEYAWKAEKKMVILIGDAPPHPLPRGKIDKSMVEEASARLGVEMNVIILPD